MKNLQDKIAVITGAGEGIGKALAKKCLQVGMKVVLADINPESLEKCKSELQAEGADIITVVTDVSDEISVNKLAETVISKFGKVHLLFNNAGIPGPVGPIWETNLNALKQVIDINLMGVIYGLQAFIPIMLKQNEDCYIVNTASGAGLHTCANISGYTITKHSIVVLTEVLHYDLKQRNINNINVAVLCPGSTKTDFAEKMQANSAEAEKIIASFKEHLKKSIPTEEVAEKTFAAIQNKQFYILTHPKQHKELVQNRLDDILKDRNPSRNEGKG